MKVTMITLPARPSLEQLKKQAKELLHACHSRQPDALRLFAEHHPGKAAAFALHDAQLVRALLAAGATPHREHADMASPEVADVICAAIAGRES